MNKEQAEAVLHITAQYVAEVQAGRQPQLSEYIARYPQYADELADFVAYYHTFESTLSTSIDSVPWPVGEFPIAIESLFEITDQQVQRSARQITTLLETKDDKALSLANLAQALDVSIDIAAKLERRTIYGASVPPVVFSRLAQTLQQPEEAIRAYFVMVPARSASISRIAEAKLSYRLNGYVDEPMQSFRQALEESSELSDKQRCAWYEALKQEGL